jgi:hypothetical protein
MKKRFVKKQALVPGGIFSDRIWENDRIAFVRLDGKSMMVDVRKDSSGVEYIEIGRARFYANGKAELDNRVVRIGSK